MQLFLTRLVNKFYCLKMRNKVIITTSAILILLFVVNNVFLRKNQTVHSDNTTNSFSVKTQEYTPQNRTIYLNSSGTVNPLHRTNLISRTSGQVIAVYFSDGEKVKRGNVILKIEDYDRVEQVEKAKALLKQCEIEYHSSQTLNKKGYGAQIRVEAAFTRLQSAKADLKRLELDLENTAVKSPIDGYIDKINANEGDFVNAGQKIAEVVNFDQILVVLYVSENEVNKIELGSTAQINLLDGKELAGEVSFITKIIEPRTGSYRVEVKVTDNEIISLQGLTASVSLPSGKRFAYKIPSSALSLSDDGVLGIKIVDDNNYVVFTPIEIVDHENDGVWIVVNNENKPIKLITLGHLFVKPGDKV
ncbi:RND family efflux transporter MFP subunit [Wolbachia endosymbiont of Armadillidium vulgare str. wVulC]|nr:RND family efflux transporter MFP subunit [Wolbachia endosymbiont of Armadillidium vulgare str. wVulC]OJH30837.1 Toluene efflux pump periplasmic linker protein TtgA precursor [Wolbachia endosymbiont of Armadillidium vulgare]OJH31828.1 Toluene efflux pump periplasmic linker protein TtgA precursor [Wolbachia endosymbiont of Armadillidium vulgare]OJH32147.1 Toluene efflux pump periplasmic linker protein TtgA precursor [Wolbachia endosymbiont of Armadillidium vulgare]